MKPLAKAQNIFRGVNTNNQNSVCVALNTIRETLPIDAYAAFVKWAAPHPRAGVKRAFLFPNTQTFRSISPFLNGTTGDLNRDLAWCTQVLTLHTQAIVDSLQSNNTISQSLFAGEYATTISTLDSLRSKRGPALSDIDLRIAVLQQQLGMEAQKAYVKTLVEENPQTRAAR